jgi:hypothetical protein
MSEHEGAEQHEGEGPVQDRDLELLSAYLDGEVTPDEAARIEADPRLQARLHELAAARDLVAQPVEPLDEGGWDALVAGARARVGDAPHHAPAAALAPAPDVAASGGAAVVELAPRRRRRAKGVALVAVAAACRLRVALSAAALRRSDSSTDQRELAGPTSSVPTTTADPQGGLGVTGSGTTSVGQAADEFRAVYTPEQLGAVADQDQLLAAARAAADRGPGPGATLVPSADPALAAVARCAAAVRRADQRLGRIRFASNATFRDKPVYVFVFQDFGIATGNEPRRLVVVGRDSCDVAASAPL